MDNRKLLIGALAIVAILGIMGGAYVMVSGAGAPSSPVAAMPTPPPARIPPPMPSPSPTPLPSPGPVPVPYSPPDGTSLQVYPRTITFTWLAATGATGYYFEEQYYDGNGTWKDWNCTNVTGSCVFTDTNFAGAAPGRWRVTALNGTNASSPPTSWLNFTFLPMPELAVPTLDSPANDSRIEANPKTLTFNWQSVADATGYRFEEDYYYNGTWKESYNTTVTDTSFTDNAFAGDQGRWRVTALDDTGQHSASQPAPWWTFSFTLQSYRP